MLARCRGAGPAGAFRRALGLRDVVAALEQIVAEEKAADAKLTQLADNTMNAKSARYASA